MQKIYLDHNATTPMHPAVLEVMLPVLGEFFGNPSSIHSEGRKARVFLDEARDQVAGLIGANPGEVIFTSGGTESNNLALLGIAFSQQEKGRHIITCDIEHPSVLNPLKQLEGLGYEVERLPVDRTGRLDPEGLKRAIKKSTILISLQHANSEVGTLQDVETIGSIARDRGVFFHTDAVQTAGKIPVNVKTLPVDFLSMSSHKLNGPKGSGALFVKRGSPPLFAPVCGGSQEKKRRGGTENVAGIVGFGKACDLARVRLQRGGEKESMDLRDYFLKRISASISGIEFLGDLENCLPNTLNLSVDGASGEALMIGLDVEGISVSTGSACSSGSSTPSHVLMKMQVPDERIQSSLRLSLGWSNTREELDKVVGVLDRLVTLNRRNSPVAG